MEGPDWPAAILMRVLLVTSVKAPRRIFCKRIQGQGSSRPRIDSAWHTDGSILLGVCPCLFLQTDFIAPLATGQTMAPLRLSGLQETGLAARVLSTALHFQAQIPRMGYLMALFKSCICPCSCHLWLEQG